MVEAEILPERDLSEPDAAALMRASRFLYSKVWDEFWEAPRLPPLGQVIGDSGRVFANFRGLVLSTTRTSTACPCFQDRPVTIRFLASSATAGSMIAARAHRPNPTKPTPSVKAFWPFVRRITPNADQREYIACGVMNWRALYISALSSARAFDWEEEAERFRNGHSGRALAEIVHRRGSGSDGEEVRLFDSPIRKGRRRTHPLSRLEQG